ncbi:MAG TPA: LysR family transcriptional regulator [Steroidobacter sp.]|uniref:LysR family transcriptional regulator n=1 Tax=Steroidobacter sp. TaxID=1978227 RepID=UPI002EDB4765
MDRLEAMSLLIDTVDTGSFSAAARKRGVPVATLTRKIGQLEEHLGAVLVIRSTRTLSLTDAGQRYLAGARHIIAQVDEVEREAAGEFVEPTGRLVVSAPRMFGRLHVLPIVGDFLQQHEGITVDLQLIDANVDVAAGAADVAVRIGALPDSSLIGTRLGSMRSVIVASPAFLDRYPTPQQPDDLATLPSIVLNIPLPAIASRPRARSPDWPVGQIRLLVSGAEAAVDAAEAGLGFVHLLHYQAADALRAGRLRLLLEGFEGEPAPVHALHAPLTQLPQKIRRFLDFSSDRLRASLLAIGKA